MNIIKEIEFWALIMHEHAQFISGALSAKECETNEKMNNYFQTFQRLFEAAGCLPEELNPEVIPNLIAENKTAVIEFIQYKKQILGKLMGGNIELALLPSFFNHMINEAMEYYRILCIASDSLRYNKVLEIIRLHRIWLPDISGHVEFVISGLDGLENVLKKEASKFLCSFNCLFIKSYEMYLMYERTTRRNGELEYFNIEIREAVEEYLVFLRKLEQLRRQSKVFASGCFSTLVINHMIKEGEYYLHRIYSLQNNTP